MPDRRIPPLLVLLVGTVCFARPAISGTLNAQDAIAVQSRVTDCEWKAANQYDDGCYTVGDLAKQVMGVCAVELTKAALAFGFSPNDPGIQADQFSQAVENVEAARKARTKKR